jgi:PAS domain S-box-containing protein
VGGGTVAHRVKPRGVKVADGSKISAWIDDALQASRRFLEIANRHTRLSPLLDEFVSEIQHLSGCEAVGVRILDETGNIPYQAYTGFTQEFYELESPLSIHGDPCMCINVIRGIPDAKRPFYTEAGSFYINGTSRFLAEVTEKEKGPARDACHRFGYESVALIPMRLGEHILGLIHLADSRENVIPKEIVELLEWTAKQLAIAFKRIKAEESLQESHRELEARVAERTRELAALNRQLRLEISARKQAEAELKEKDRGLAEAQRIANLGNWDWNIIDGTLSWSEEIYRIFGLQPHDFGATYPAFLAAIHPDDRQAVENAVNAALADPGVRYSIEHRVIRPDGSERNVHERGEVTFDSEERPIRMLGTVLDITERKQEELKLRSALAEIEKLKNQLAAESAYLQEEIKLAHNFENIIGQSDVLKYVLFKVEQVAATDATVLILGETGTGKELIARAIHSRSSRRERSMVKVNCGALPPNLIESELFGHEKGAFTGAWERLIGRFEIADGATLFLDEVGDLPLELQTKLLRVLQDGEFERLGSTKTLKTDVRIIAATNRDLEGDVQGGRFRRDLWFRLNVFPITVPPLRRRLDDLSLLVKWFVERYAKKYGKHIETVPSRIISSFQKYDWPGNVRELENVVERAVINTQGTTLQLAATIGTDPRGEQIPDEGQTLDQLERAYIRKICEQTGWRIEGPRGAARILGLKPSTLRSRMQKLGVRKPF